MVNGGWVCLFTIHHPPSTIHGGDSLQPHGRRVVPQPRAAAGGTRHLAGQLVELPAVVVGGAAGVVDGGEEALVGEGERLRRTLSVEGGALRVGLSPTLHTRPSTLHSDFTGPAVEDDALLRRREVPPRGLRVDAGRGAQGVQHPRPQGVRPRVRPHRHRPAAEAAGGVRDEDGQVRSQFGADALTVGAPAEGGVEAEVVRRQLLEAALAGRAHQLHAGDGRRPRADVVLGRLDVRRAPAVREADDHVPRGHRQRRLQRLRDPPPLLGVQLQPVRDHADHVVVRVVQRRRVLNPCQPPVHGQPREAGPLQVLEDVRVRLEAGHVHRRDEHRPLAGVIGEEPVDELVDRLGLDRHLAFGAVRSAGPRVQHAEVVVDLRRRADGGPRGVAGRLLLDADGRRKPRDRLVPWFRHLREELPRVAAQRLHVPPLPLRVERVHRQRRLAAAGRAAEDAHAVPRDGQRDVLEVVLSRAADGDLRQLAVVRGCRRG